MSFQTLNIDLNIDSSNIPQNFTFAPIISKNNAVKESTTFGTRVIVNELLKAIDENRSEEVFEILETFIGGVNFSFGNLIAFANPIPDKILFSTNAFKNIINCGITPYEGEVDGDTLNFNNILLYNLILERFYGIDHIDTEYIFETYCNGYHKYFELRVDFTFVEISCNGKLPKIDLSTIRQNKFDSNNVLIEIVKNIDLSKFNFSGFSILRLINRDKKFIIKKLHNLINNVNIKQKDTLKQELNDIFYSIIEKNNVEFFFLPIFELSGFPISENEYAKNSILLGQYFSNNEICTSNSSIYSYLNNPKIWSYGIDQDLNVENETFIKILNNLGITNYLGIPLFHREQFVGFLEIYSYNNNFNKNDALKIKQFLPHFAQLSNDLVHYLKIQLNNIILDNYTNIQPALKWRFNEVAVSYFTQQNNNKEKAELEKIIFEDVYPIYGSVDIKDSTKIRSAAQKEFVLSHLKHLLNLFYDLAKIHSHSYISSCIDKIENAIKCVNDIQFEKKLYHLRDLLESETVLMLNELLDDESSDDLINDIIRNIMDIVSTIQNTKNYPFEKSLKAITHIIKEEYDLLNNHLQNIFPCYFDTFRTDGVEYDAYIGQSITPTMTFKDEMLLDMFKQQIVSMINIIKKVRQAAKNNPISLQTTQLLFVHPDKITISFRQDEKRFDVDGGYNIRYQIIKKRIDKVLIENTRERLVQPDSIAIVYSNDNVKNNIIEVLKELITCGVLQEDIQSHNLEELQGISALRALRVHVY